MNLSSLAQPAPKEQLPLPTGPYAAILGGRRERTDEDRDWYSRQLAVQHVKRIDKLVFERLAFYGSLNSDRMAYPAVARLAREALCSDRSARYALRRLDAAGLIECLYHKGGRTTSRYRVVGSTDCRPGLQTVQARAANRAADVLKKGKKRSKKALSLSADVQFQDHGETEKDEGKAVNLSLIPSRSEEKSAPVREIANPRQVAKYCKIRRKLGREVNHTMETEFDRLLHPEKKRVIDDLEAQERELAHEGKVEPAPIEKPKGFLTAAAQEAQRIATCAHVPAADLPINCGKCGAYIGKE